MLVLVLILVVIALVLLLAGWFLHLVVLAWTSVGISVLAGLVLIYDGLQTRAAVRAGRQAAGARDGERDGTGGGATTVGAGAGALGAGAYGGGSDAGGGADMEPATQVLPIVPAASAAPTNASEETIVMPVVAPSGEPEAPSGVSRSSDFSSQSVTDARASEGAVERPGDGTTGVAPGDPEPGGDGGDPATGTADGGGTTPGSGPEVAGATRGPDGGRTATVTAAAAAGAVASAATDGGSDGGEATRTADARTTDARTTDVRTTTAGTASDVGGVGADVGSADDGATRATQVSGVDDPTSVAAAHRPVSDGDEQTRVAAQQQAQRQPPPQIDTSGEAPEEPYDATLASLAARLPDEVVVIDERPRYHLQACPSLPGQPVIPLPVGEAVDLGFTPCGWCTPNRVLGERHPAEAR